MKTSPTIVLGTVLAALLVLLVALCAATVVVCRRIKFSRTIIELHSTSETRPLLASGRKSHSKLHYYSTYDFMHMKCTTLSRR